MIPRDPRITVDAGDGRQCDASLKVIRVLRGEGHEALWAGGCVRDLVLGRQPKDFDIATSATPEEVDTCFDRTVLVGAAYGVVRVLLGEVEVEVATFRTDGGYSDGRRPDQVSWTTAEGDVQRRDFTINGLLGDPLTADQRPRVIDHVGGLADLNNRLVRAIGDPDARFMEDHLRILRAIRFAARLDFRIHEDTWAAIERHGDTLATVSAERIRNELQGMWTEGGPLRALELLVKADLLTRILPELTDATSAGQRLAGMGELSPSVAWATVLLRISEPGSSIPDWGRRLRISKTLCGRVLGAIRIAKALGDYPTMSLCEQKRLLGSPEVSDALEVAAMAVHAGELEPGALDGARQDLATWEPGDLHPPSLISGDDLREAGFTPGPGFGVALNAVEEAQLEGRCSSREEALEIASALLTR